MRLTRPLLLPCLLALVLGPNGGAGAAEEPPAGWRERFNAVYRLADDEALKLVAPPFIPERDDYCRYEVNKGRQDVAPPVGQFMFFWTGRLQLWSQSQGGGSVGSAVGHCGLERYEVQIDEGLARRALEGDWIIRNDAPREKRMAALRQILRQRLGRDVRIEPRKLERDVVVVSGKLPQDLTGDATVQLYGDPQELRGPPSGGGSGTLGELFKHLGGSLDRKFVDQTAAGSGRRRVVWQWYGFASQVEGDVQKEKVLFDNLARQTGLTFTPQTADVEVWVIADPTGDKTPL
jgi:hypothetical protein